MLPKFEYYSPRTLDEALELLSKYGADAKVFAGGTDLFVLMRDRVIKPKALIDLKRIPELSRIEYGEGEGMTIGATVTLNALLENVDLKNNYYVLWDAIHQMGDQILRNRMTLVGNICNASPAADSAPPLLVLEAFIEAVSKEGKRRIPIKDFFLGVKKTVLKPNEIVTSIHIPKESAGGKGRYVKAMRVWSEDLAVVGVAALALKKGEELDIRLAYASVAPTPVRAYDAEKVFKKKAPIDKLIDEASELAVKAVSPITDVRGGAEYRKHLVKVLTKRALREVIGGE